MKSRELSKQLGENAYLNLAYNIIMDSGHPMSPVEIISTAIEKNILPKHLNGKTKHKTLSARLAEHIRKWGNSSVFFRTGPARFFIHTLASKDSVPAIYKKVFIGNLRAKKIRKENVLVAPTNNLNKYVKGEFIEYNNEQFENFFKNYCKFEDRATAENDDNVKQFVTFSLVFHNHNILIHDRGKFSTASDLLKGQTSVGFGGHVNDQDFDLFHSGGLCFKNNSTRELREELFFDELYLDFEDTRNRTDVLGFINVDETEDARHHIAVLVSFNHKSPELPKKGELSINRLRWLPLNTPLNDLSSFDLWSGIILRNLYNGKIKLSKNTIGG